MFEKPDTWKKEQNRGNGERELIKEGEQTPFENLVTKVLATEGPRKTAEALFDPLAKSFFKKRALEAEAVLRENGYSLANITEDKCIAQADKHDSTFGEDSAMLYAVIKEIIDLKAKKSH